MAQVGERGPSDDAGVVVAERDGRRSTSAVARAALAAAAAEVDGDLAARIAAAGDWRRAYVGHLSALTVAELRSRDAAQAPRAGLAALQAQMAWRQDGVDRPLTELPTVTPRRRLRTLTVDGEGGPAATLSVPYRGQQLSGGTLHRQLDRWVAAGVVEEPVAVDVRRVADHPEWLTLPGRTVVVLGAASQMGPLEPLLRWGATVAAVDLPGRALWERVLVTARTGAGRALVAAGEPAGDDTALAEVAGVDVLRQAPELVAWLTELPGPLVLGDYVYAPGAAYLQLAAAVDAVFDAVRAARTDEVATAVLVSPTDALPAPPAAVQAARGAREAGAARLARGASAGRAFRPSYPPSQRDLVVDGEGGWGVADCLVPQQGPNYALAKRVHQWRARAWRREGLVSSANVAPPTRTRSVTGNRLLAAAYAGAHTFGVEVFEPETSATLMAALLVHDLCAPDAPARPGRDDALAVLGRTAAHGGLFRLPWVPRSVLPLAAVRGLPAAFRR